MKKLIFSVMLAAMASSACVDKTEFGPCIGVADDKSPRFHYKVSTRNAILAIVFAETIIVPIIVVADELECPVAFKEK